MERTENSAFGMKDKIGYMFGDFGNDFTFLFASVFLMVFYTKVLGISAGMVGTLFLVARCVDAFTDITMGRIVDKGKTSKNGRFRPWILRMCGPVALASFLMYQGGMKAAPQGLKILYMFVTYILWGSIFYTAINIPYGSMASVLSPDADDRAALSTFRSVGAVLAQLIVGVGAPLLVYTTDAVGNQVVNEKRFTLVAGVFSVAAIICYLLCYFMTTERVKVQTKETQEKAGFGQTAKDLLSNRALLGIILAALLLLVAQIMTQSINQYLFIDYFKNKEALSVMTLAGVLPSLALAPFAVPVSKRFGKKEIGIFGCLCSAISCFLSDTPVTLAAKSLLRVGCPVVIAVSTNDGLGASGENIARLYQRKHYYFVPYGQDDPNTKPQSLKARFELLPQTLEAALEGRQLQPVLQCPCG